MASANPAPHTCHSSSAVFSVGCMPGRVHQQVPRLPMCVHTARRSSSPSNAGAACIVMHDVTVTQCSYLPMRAACARPTMDATARHSATSAALLAQHMEGRVCRMQVCGGASHCRRRIELGPQSQHVKYVIDAHGLMYLPTTYPSYDWLRKSQCALACRGGAAQWLHEGPYGGTYVQPLRYSLAWMSRDPLRGRGGGGGLPSRSAHMPHATEHMHVHRY